MKSILVTGASTGIGYATTQELINNGYRVFANVRKEKDAKRLLSEFGINCFPLIFDVRDQAAIDKAVKEVERRLGGKGLYGLFNNAGTALSGPIMHQPIEDIEEMLNINVMGVIRVTRSFLPLLGADPYYTSEPGRILNMSSVGGKVSMPFIGMYCATKHAIEGLSDALRRELMLFGIKVSIIEPGAVATPIWNKAPSPEDSGYENTAYEESVIAFLKAFAEEGKKGMNPSKVASLVREIFESKKPKNRYMISPTPFTDKVLLQYLPGKMLDGMLAKEFKLNPKQGNSSEEESIESKITEN
ncbi:MAG: SDR family oxidoreductase [Bacteroidia bacterium]|nr:SDR family oxidoreductase [Bacteroidia bacterium]